MVTIVCTVPLERGIIRETKRAYLCTDSIWWPKSHAILIGKKLMVSQWIASKKNHEHRYNRDHKLVGSCAEPRDYPDNPTMEEEDECSINGEW